MKSCVSPICAPSLPHVVEGPTTKTRTSIHWELLLFGNESPSRLNKMPPASAPRNPSRRLCCLHRPPLLPQCRRCCRRPVTFPPPLPKHSYENLNEYPSLYVTRCRKGLKCLARHQSPSPHHPCPYTHDLRLEHLPPIWMSVGTSLRLDILLKVPWARTCPAIPFNLTRREERGRKKLGAASLPSVCFVPLALTMA